MSALAAGVVGGPWAPVAGVAARLFSNAVTKSQAAKLGELIRSRSPLAALKTPVSVSPSVIRGAIPVGTDSVGADQVRREAPLAPAATPSPAPAATQSAPSQAAAAPPVITTKEQYDALPSGTKFVGSDGKRYTRP